MELQQHDQLVQSLYQGVLAPEGWQPVMHELRALTQTDALVLLLWDEHTGMSMVGDESGTDPMQGLEYERQYALDDPGQPFIVHTPVNGWYFDQRDLGLSVIRTHPFYQEFLRKYGMQSIMWTKLMCVDGVHAGLSFQAELHRPAYSADDVKAIAPLLPHLSQAMLLRWRFQKLSQMARLGQQVLDHLDSPVLVINAKAHILFANTAAQAWLKQGNHPFAHQAALHQATPWPQLLNLARQICSTEPVCVATLELDADEGRKQAYLVGLPLQQAHPIAQGWSQPVGLVVVHDPTRHQAPWPQLLRQLFGLTVAESRLVEQLAQHHSLVDAAAKLNIGSETGRSQLKSVFRKTGMRNQSALLQLLTKLLHIR